MLSKSLREAQNSLSLQLHRSAFNALFAFDRTTEVFAQRIDGFRWKLIRMLLHVGEHELVGVGDDEARSEHLDLGADRHVAGPVVERLVGGGTGFGHARPLQVRPSDHAGVADVRLVDRDHVVGKAVAHNEAAPLVLRPDAVL